MVENGAHVKEEALVDSPTSVLEEEVCFFIFVCVYVCIYVFCAFY